MMPGADITARYVAAFEQFEKGLNGEASSPVHQLRRKGFASFRATGFPTTKQEDWRFTNVAPIAGMPCEPVQGDGIPRLTPEDARRWAYAGSDVIRVVVHGGIWAPELCAVDNLPTGVRIESLAAAAKRNDATIMSALGSVVKPDENPFSALNSAFLRDGVVILLEEHAVVDRPVELLFVNVDGATPRLSAPRTLVIAGKHSKLTLVQTFGGHGGEVLTTAVTELLLDEGAVVEHDVLEAEGALASHVHTMKAFQAGNSVFRSNAVALGGAIVRNTTSSILRGEFAECVLNGLSIAGGTQLIDNHTVIDHAAPNCTSHEIYKSIIDGHGHGVFNGKIFVREGAQKTDARQTNRTLLLSDDAIINTKPQLEIFADDVKCTHGATVGQLDENQVFYLRARGIGAAEAREMLTFAFAADVAERIHVAPFREQLHLLVREQLERRTTEHGND